MPKYRQNHKLTRFLLTEPNCVNVAKDIIKIMKGPLWNRLSSEKRNQLLMYLKEINRRNMCVDWAKLNEIKKYLGVLHKTYGG